MRSRTEWTAFAWRITQHSNEVRMLLCFMLCNILRARTRSRTGNGMQINKFRNKHIYFVIFTERYKSPPPPALWAPTSLCTLECAYRKAYILWIGRKVLVPIKFYSLFLLNVKKANQKKASCADNRDFPELRTSSSCLHFFNYNSFKGVCSQAWVALTYSAYAFCLFDRHKRESWLHASNFILCKLGNIVKAKRKVTLYISVVRFQHFFHKKNDERGQSCIWRHTRKKRQEWSFALIILKVVHLEKV